MNGEKEYYLKIYYSKTDPRYRLKMREFSLYFAMASTCDNKGMIALTPIVVKELRERLEMSDRTFRYAVEGIIESGLIKKLSAQDFILNPHYTTTSWGKDRDILVEEYNKI